MTRTKEPQPRRMPDFASREEMAAWFDTHDTVDYEHAFTPVKVRFAKNLSEPITIRLNPETLAEVRARARRRGIGPTTLIRMWILDHLRDEGRQRSARP